MVQTSNNSWGLFNNITSIYDDGNTYVVIRDPSRLEMNTTHTCFRLAIVDMTDLVLQDADALYRDDIHSKCIIVSRDCRELPESAFIPCAPTHLTWESAPQDEDQRPIRLQEIHKMILRLPYPTICDFTGVVLNGKYLDRFVTKFPLVIRYYIEPECSYPTPQLFGKLYTVMKDYPHVSLVIIETFDDTPGANYYNMMRNWKRFPFSDRIKFYPSHNEQIVLRDPAKGKKIRNQALNAYGDLGRRYGAALLDVICTEGPHYLQIMDDFDDLDMRAIESRVESYVGTKRKAM